MSWLEARHHHGEWFLRIDDLDTPRVVAPAADNIQQTLDAFGLFWDGSVQWQSERRAIYKAAAEELQQRGLSYPCNCSRKQLEATAASGDAGRIYPGHCRQAKATGKTSDHAIRIRVGNAEFEFEDRFQGWQQRQLATEDGDFVLWRRDNIASYHLATVLDDAELGITHSTRGIDLLPITGRQLFLQQQLGLEPLNYGHFAVLNTPAGQKLSKQNKAAPVLINDQMGSDSKKQVLLALIRCIFSNPPGPQLLSEPIPMLLNWAVERWPENTLASKTSLLAPALQ